MQVLHKDSYELCTNHFLFMRFEVLMAANIRTETLWDVTQRSLINR
jgi:hypothetical protein